MKPSTVMEYGYQGLTYEMRVGAACLYSVCWDDLPSRLSACPQRGLEAHPEYRERDIAAELT